MHLNSQTNHLLEYYNVFFKKKKGWKVLNFSIFGSDLESVSVIQRNGSETLVANETGYPANETFDDNILFDNPPL